MQIEYILELLGTIVFAISGALAAGESAGKNWFGVVFVGFVTAIGGGSLRDILLGSYPLVWVKDVNFIYAILVGILIMRFFFIDFNKIRKEMLLFDAMGIALFAILGTEKALGLGVHPLVAAIMGMFTAVMGGVIRDTLVNKTPIIFGKEIYATACLIGSGLFILLSYFEMHRTTNMIISIVFITAFRLMSLKYKWYIPIFRMGEFKK